MKTMAEQAIEGLDLTMDAGIWMVQDGEDVWGCDAADWRAAVGELSERAEASGEDGSAIAYGALCNRVAASARRNGRAVVSLNGSPTGEASAQRELAQRMVDAGLMESDAPLALEYLGEPTTAEPLATEQIQQLREQADDAGDEDMVAECGLALSGDRAAIARCASFIRDMEE